MTETEQTTPSQQPSRWTDYLKLVRLPNIFTAWADVMMGYFVTHAAITVGDIFPMAVLMLISACFYAGGVALNDLQDIEYDARRRSHRPLPSRAISMDTARGLIRRLFMIGIALSIGAGCMAVLPESPEGFSLLAQWPRLVPVGVALLLLGSIWGYDVQFKRTMLGPPMMGACRGFNVLLGMSLTANFWTGVNLFIALAMTIYIAGVTWFARSEAIRPNRREMLGGAVLTVVGMALVMAVPAFGKWELGTASPFVLPDVPWMPWYAFFFLLIAWFGARVFGVVLDPVPKRVQNAVKLAIMTLVVLDAAIAYTVHGPIAFLILALLLPALYIGRWIESA